MCIGLLHPPPERINIDFPAVYLTISGLLAQTHSGTFAAFVEWVPIKCASLLKICKIN